MEDILLILFFLALAIQAILLFFIFPAILFHKGEKTENLPGLSIVIAAHNEKENLKNLVPLLLRQNYPDLEIIIADDRSSDESWGFLSSIKDARLKTIRIDKVPANYNPKKFALTEAIRRSSKEIILLTDADCIPASDIWARKMSERFSGEKEIVLGYSPYQKEKGFLNLFIRFETFLTGLQYLSFACVGFPYMGVGRNMAYLKKHFGEKGFEGIRSMTGGDDDLFIGKVSSGKNTTVCIDRDAQMISLPKKSFLDFFRQKQRHMAVGIRYSFRNKIKAGLFPLSQIFLYFSLLLLFFTSIPISALLAIFILRTLAIIVIFVLIARKLGETINWFWFPVLDLSYLISYIIIGIPAVFTRNKIKWK